jgi:hypothetical protein
MTLKHLFKLNNIVGGGGGERLTRRALKNKKKDTSVLELGEDISKDSCKT